MPSCRTLPVEHPDQIAPPFIAGRRTGQRPDRHRTKPGCSPDAACFSSVRFSLRRRCKGWCLSSSCLRAAPRFPFLSHIFSMAGSKQSGEGAVSRARGFGAFIGAQRRPLTRLPRSVHSPAKKWEITASPRRCFFPAAVSSGPHAAATWRRVRVSLR
jgi:hypothetical protein